MCQHIFLPLFIIEQLNVTCYGNLCLFPLPLINILTFSLKSSKRHRCGSCAIPSVKSAPFSVDVSIKPLLDTPSKLRKHQPVTQIKLSLGYPACELSAMRKDSCGSGRIRAIYLFNFEPYVVLCVNCELGVWHRNALESWKGSCIGCRKDAGIAVLSGCLMDGKWLDTFCESHNFCIFCYERRRLGTLADWAKVMVIFSYNVKA